MNTISNTTTTHQVSKNTVFLLCAVTLLYFFLNFQRTAIPGAIFDELQQDFAVSATYVTALGSSFMYIYAFGQLLAGFFADKYGGFRVISIGGLLMATGCLCAPLCKNIWLVYLCRAMTGLGGSAIYISSIKELVRACPGTFSRIFGGWMFFGYLGAILAGTPFSCSAAAFGWRSSLLTIGILMATIYAFFAICYAKSTKTPCTDAKLHLAAFLAPFRQKSNRNICYFVCLNWGIYYSILTIIGKKFLQDYCQMGLKSASLIITIMSAVGAFHNGICAFISHAMGDRRKPYLLGGALITCTCFLLLTLALLFHFHHPILCLLLIAFTPTSNCSAISVSYLKETNPPERLAITLAGQNFLSYLLVALIGNLIGLLLEIFPPAVVDGIKIYSRNSYLLVFLMCACLSFFGVYGTSHLKETHGKHINV